MKYYTLYREQFIARPIQEVYSFFDRPENLEKITPSFLGFKITSPKPILMKKGTHINYTIQLFGVPMAWTSWISDYNPPHHFVDMQIRGPYAYWHHTHEFHEMVGGTMAVDRVKYAIPLGPIGRLAHFLFVKKQLNTIFNYRSKIIQKLFSETEKPNQGGPMKVVLAGSTGFIGKELIGHLQKKGHEVTLLTRNPHAVTDTKIKAVQWDGKDQGAWSSELDGADAVINLSGENIAAKRWSKTQKEKIISSRINSTRALVQAIEKANSKPKTLINASAVGFYGNVPDGDVTERTAKGTGFLAETCNMWEQEAKRAEKFGVRVALMRIGVVLEKGGGALSKMELPFKFFAGGPLGSGKQWFPWIHRSDVVGLILFTLKNEALKGPINTTAPQPATMKDFCAEFGHVIRRPSWAPVPSFMLKLMLGEMSEMLLGGQKALPAKALQAGYPFQYPDVTSALQSISK